MARSNPSNPPYIVVALVDNTFQVLHCRFLIFTKGVLFCCAVLYCVQIERRFDGGFIHLLCVYAHIRTTYTACALYGQYMQYACVAFQEQYFAQSVFRLNFVWEGRNVLQFLIAKEHT